MSDKFWLWINRIRLLAACLVGGLLGFWVIYESDSAYGCAGEYIGGGIAVVATLLLYYGPVFIIRLISNTRGDDALDEWVEGFRIGLESSRKDDDPDD